MQEFIEQLNSGKQFSSDQLQVIFSGIIERNFSDEEIIEFLTGLSARGETTQEITSLALLLRSKMKKVKAPLSAIDLCGTGGDGLSTYNISTAVAIVAASCGAVVAKHGNKAVSSKSGSSDILSYLGVNLDAEINIVEKSLSEIGIAFLMAPKYHPVLANVADLRKKIGKRTIFNLLGPILNPAGVKRQLVGVYNKDIMQKYANVLNDLGADKAYIAHSADAMDEISVSDKTYICELNHGEISNYEIAPEDFAINRYNIEEIIGGDAADNAKAMLELFGGKKGAYRDIVSLNAAFALKLADIVDNIEEGLALSYQSLDSGKAANKLKQLIGYSNGTTA